MLIDLLDANNYIMVNKNAIQILGLQSAVYISELLTIYKKAIKKNKLIEKKYFLIDRNFITKDSSLTKSQQLTCEKALCDVDIIDINKNNNDLLYLNVEILASILSAQDVRLLQEVSKTVKVKETKDDKKLNDRQRSIEKAKLAIRCNNPKILYAMKDWIESICANPNKFVSEQQVIKFQDKLNDYCNGDQDKALKIIELACIHQYIDCDWAITAYEKQSNTPKINLFTPSQVRVTTQKRCTGLSKESF